MREHHAVAVQHRYHREENGPSYSEDYIYVVGGFTNVRQAFCDNRACGSRTTYRMAIDDAWVSNNGFDWVQIKSASGSHFRGRGGHATVLTHANPYSIGTSNDRLWVIGGENSNPDKDKVEYLNDVWNGSARLSNPTCSVCGGMIVVGSRYCMIC